MPINDLPRCQCCVSGYLVLSEVRQPNVYSCGHRDLLADIGVSPRVVEENLQEAFDAGMDRAMFEEGYYYKDYTPPSFDQWIEEFKKNAPR